MIVTTVTFGPMPLDLWGVFNRNTRGPVALDDRVLVFTTEEAAEEFVREECSQMEPVTEGGAVWDPVVLPCVVLTDQTAWE